MVDRGAASAEREVPKDCKVVPGLDARLVFIDAANGIDKFCVLQGLKGSDGCYSLIRQGDTGSLGVTKIKGPSEKAEVEKILADAFREKTGCEWGTITPGDRAKPGMYWLQKKMKTNVKAQWQYYVDDGVDGKRVAWYNYDAGASDEVEEIYAQHVSNQREKRTNERIVKSGYFSYKVDLDNKTQTNTRTNKVRTIRRIMCERKSMKTMKAIAMKTLAMKKASVKSMKKAKKKPVKKVMKAMKAMKMLSNRVQRRRVLDGKMKQTANKLKKADLMRNPRGYIVSRKRAALGRKHPWILAVKAARKALGTTNMFPKKGSELYKKSHEIYAARSLARSASTASLARGASAKSLARSASAKSVARGASAKSLARGASAKSLARGASAKSLARSASASSLKRSASSK